MDLNSPEAVVESSEAVKETEGKTVEGGLVASGEEVKSDEVSSLPARTFFDNRFLVLGRTSER